MRQFVHAVRLFIARARAARQHPQRPPVLGILFAPSAQYNRSIVCTDLVYGAMIALVQSPTTIKFVAAPMRFWHQDTASIPLSAWKPWKSVATGDFLDYARRSNARVGTYHTSGEAALIAQGFDHRIAHEMARPHAVRWPWIDAEAGRA